MIVEDRGLVFDATRQNDNSRVCAFVSMVALGDGTLICGFQNGPTKHAVTSTVRLCRSRDDGRNWEELPIDFERTIDGKPGSLSSAEIVEAEPGRLLLFSTWFDRSDPERPLFDPETEGILHAKQLMAVSTDQGQSWGSWQKIPTPGLTGCAATGPSVRWDDGTIAFAFESYKDYDDPSPARHGAWLLVSRDAGRSFEAPFLVAQHPDHSRYYWDQRLCLGTIPGEFIAMFWTHDLKQKTDLNVHFRRGLLGVDDFERHPIIDTGIPGQICAPVLLDDGRILAFVVDRSQPGTMKLWQSHDDGRTWPETDALVVYTHEERAAVSQGATDIDFKQYWEDMSKWSFGHPAIRLLPDGRVLVVHYAGTPDCMSVHLARIDIANS